MISETVGLSAQKVQDTAVFQQVVEHFYPKEVWPLKLRESIPALHLDSLWVVYRDGQPVGRFSVYENPELSYQGLKTICLGHYECIADNSVARFLLENAASYCQQKGAKYVIGPMNGSTWENYRLATTNATTFFLEPLQQDYYASQWQQNGFETLATYESHLDTKLVYDESILQAVTQRLQASNLMLRQLDMQRFEEELKRIFALCNRVFQDNFLYSPITEEAFVQKYLPLKPYLDADLCWLVSNENQEVAGLLFAIPDHLDTSGKTVIVKTLCRLPGGKYQSVIPALGNQFVKTAKEKGYQRVIHAFMHQRNASIQVSNHFSGHAFKQYVLFGKRVS